jgi:hypothetical protein
MRQKENNSSSFFIMVKPVFRIDAAKIQLICQTLLIINVSYTFLFVSWHTKGKAAADISHTGLPLGISFTITNCSLKNQLLTTQVMKT